MKTLTRYINNRRVEITIRAVDRGNKAGVQASVGWVKAASETGANYYTIFHAPFQDFSQFYLAQPRPVRLSAQFKSSLVNKLDLSRLMFDIKNFYKAEVTLEKE
jgi:hypothetical protein